MLDKTSIVCYNIFKNSERLGLSMDNRGRFIALEGIDGSGKSTQVNMLASRLRELGAPCYATKEPTDSPIGSLIRQILTGRLKADKRILANLFAADRADHLLNETDGICDKIKAGVNVITDRYYFSSYAYHGVDMDMDWVISLNALSYNILRPDITVFLDIPVERAMQRIKDRRRHEELFESEARLRLTRDKYFEAFDKLGGEERVSIIGADAGEVEVAERIWGEMCKLFRLTKPV